MSAPQLNIKDAEAARLVRELVALTGETQTEAVREALRDRLEREKAERRSRATRTAEDRRREVDKAIAEIKKIQEEVCRLGLAAHALTDNDLYDENGLPK
jgi:antitoxin VapB